MAQVDDEHKQELVDLLNHLKKLTEQILAYEKAYFETEKVA